MFIIKIILTNVDYFIIPTRLIRKKIRGLSLKVIINFIYIIFKSYFISRKIYLIFSLERWFHAMCSWIHILIQLFQIQNWFLFDTYHNTVFRPMYIATTYIIVPSNNFLLKSNFCFLSNILGGIYVINIQHKYIVRN